LPPSATALRIGQGASLSRILQWSIPKKDLGIVPLVLCCPVMFYPRVFEGDTQPWVLLMALVALFTFRTEQFANRRDVPLALLSVLCIAVYAVRAHVGFGLARTAYTYLTFLVLWTVCQRDRGGYLSAGVKLTVIVWFIAGAWEYLLVKAGYDLTIGRYVAGRSGVPSLTPEASYYGSLSMLQLMYLLSQKGSKNGIYITCAATSVVLSGSVLAMLLLVFPLWKLRPLIRFSAVALLGLLVLADFYAGSAGLVGRVASIASLGTGTGIASIIFDASLNLRVGHIYFTMFLNLIPELELRSPVGFMAQYNAFAAQSGIFMDTGSDYILPAIGEMIYGAGVVALALLFVFVRRALARCSTRRAKFQRFVFIMACMINPISLSNIFLVLYAQSEE
jgi:hypothetical protein